MAATPSLLEMYKKVSNPTRTNKNKIHLRQSAFVSSDVPSEEEDDDDNRGAGIAGLAFSDLKNLHREGVATRRNVDLVEKTRVDLASAMRQMSDRSSYASSEASAPASVLSQRSARYSKRSAVKSSRLRAELG